jgi:hypothetical protein
MTFEHPSAKAQVRAWAHALSLQEIAIFAIGVLVAVIVGIAAGASLPIA